MLGWHYQKVYLDINKLVCTKKHCWTCNAGRTVFPGTLERVSFLYSKFDWRGSKKIQESQKPQGFQKHLFLDTGEGILNYRASQYGLKGKCNWKSAAFWTKTVIRTSARYKRKGWLWVQHRFPSSLLMVTFILPCVCSLKEHWKQERVDT